MCEYGCPETVERWLPIPGYEHYEVSNLGRVYSIPRNVVDRHGRVSARGGLLRKASFNTQGYLHVAIYNERGMMTRKIHQLVLEAFVGPRESDQETLHRDGVREHNCLTNLEWGTKSANAFDRVRHGNDWQARKAACPRGHVLVGTNLRLLSTRKTRICLACSRAKQVIADRKRRNTGLEIPDLQQLSDQYFAALVTDSLKTWVAAGVYLQRFAQPTAVAA